MSRLRIGIDAKARSLICVWAIPKPLGMGLTAMQIKRKLWRELRVVLSVNEEIFKSFEFVSRNLMSGTYKIHV